MFTRFLFKTHESIKVILAILLSVIIITSFSSCAIKNNSEQNHLVYYTLNDKDSLSWIIEKHNKYCINSNNPSFQIEIVKFNSEQEMSTQISTEIMAGSGPDIISLSQKLPFEKLIESRSLMNIYDLLKDDNSSNAINLDDYNVNILNAGVYDNGLYIVPLFYGVDVLVSTEERLKNCRARYSRCRNSMIRNLREMHRQELDMKEKELSRLARIIDKAFRWFPMFKEMLRMEKFCAMLGFSKEMTESLLVKKEALKCSGKIYSEQHRRNFDIKDDILRVENDPDDESRLSLTINRKPIADWFREQWHRLRYGTRLSQQEEKKSRGIKM